MFVGQPPGSARFAGVGAPPGGEPHLQRGRLERFADADRHPAAQPRPWPAAQALIGNAVGLAVDPHPRPGVGNAKADPGDGNHRQAGGFQRAEQHTVAAGVIDRVQPDIGFGEGTEIGQRHEGADSEIAHLKRHQRGVGHSIGEYIRAGSRREQVRDIGGTHRPMNEGQVFPPLVEKHRVGQRRGRDGESVPGRGGIRRARRHRILSRSGWARTGCRRRGR